MSGVLRVDQDLNPLPLWEALDAQGRVMGTWYERGGYTPAVIREYARQFHPNATSLRVTRYIKTVTRDEL